MRNLRMACPKSTASEGTLRKSSLTRATGRTGDVPESAGDGTTVGATDGAADGAVAGATIGVAAGPLSDNGWAKRSFDGAGVTGTGTA